MDFGSYRCTLSCFGLILLLTACTPYLRPDNVVGPQTYIYKTNVVTGGFQRSYRVHVPAGYDADHRLPLVVVLHGAFDTAKGIEIFTGFSRLADRERFIVLYPNGIGLVGYLQHWNAGHCCGKAADDDIDDVGFIAAAIDDVSRKLSVDKRRIYMVGFSNGGMMTYRFAAERGDLLAAAAPMAASAGGRRDASTGEWRLPDPVRPLPLLVMHGLADDDIPYAGGRSRHRGGERTYWSVEDSISFWANANGCPRPPESTATADGRVRIRSWRHCRDNTRIVLYLLEGWGHVWPGPYFTKPLPPDDPLKDFDAAEIVWQFFKTCERP